MSNAKDMNTLRQQYGEHLFEKDREGFYFCFFEGCGQSMKANFQRHVCRHEELGDRVDDDISEQRREAHIASRLQSMREEKTAASVQATPAILRDRGGPTRVCGHDDHDVLWPDLPRKQHADAFYSHSNKCKKCYIWLQQERTRRQRAGTYEPLRNTERAQMARQRITVQPSETLQGEEKIHEFFFPWGSGKKRGKVNLGGEQDLDEEITPQMLLDTPNIYPAALYALYREGGENAAIEDAVLSLPHVRVTMAATGVSPSVGLRHAATAAVWGRAIIAELRDHPYARAARAELDQLDVDVEQGSLRQLEEALCRVLTVAMHRNAGKIESAQLNQLIIHVRARVAQAKDLLKQMAGREGGVCSACNQCEDPSPGSGAPLFCSGACGRVFHASCAGNPDETDWLCDDCKQGRLVLHYDRKRRDWYSNVIDEGASHVTKNWNPLGPFFSPHAPPTDVRTIGKLVRCARVNQVLMQKKEAVEDDNSGGDDYAGDFATMTAAEQPSSKRRAKRRDDDDYFE